MTGPRSRARVLVADDDAVTRHVFSHHLTEWGYTVVQAAAGDIAWDHLRGDARPDVALLDWHMPELDGPEICRRVRAAAFMPPPYLILITARERSEDVVAGLDAGADDYLVKPVPERELRARIAVAERVANLQAELVARVRDLEDERAHVRQLQGILPICSSCNKIRDDAGAYQHLETYISSHSHAVFSHGYCPECEARVMREMDRS